MEMDPDNLPDMELNSEDSTMNMNYHKTLKFLLFYQEKQHNFLKFTPNCSMPCVGI
jgi:hypothetical protein